MRHFICIFSFLLFMAISSDIIGQQRVCVINKGIGGNNSFDLLRRVHRDVLELKPDLVIVLVGTNDLMNTKKMVPADQFIQNLEQLTDTLTFHDMEVVVVSPPPVDEKYLFERHDSTMFNMPPNTILSHAAAAIKELSQRKGYLFVDLFHDLNSKGIPDHNKDEIIVNITNSGKNDGVHFTKTGNVLLAQLIFNTINEKYGSLKGKRIVCFGDSLTFGAFMEGEGTTNGNTYPAVLKKLIRSHEEY